MTQLIEPLELIDTITLMNSDDYKDRFKAEYYQLTIRLNKLKQIIVDYENHKLSFIPVCPLAILEVQYTEMLSYQSTLRTRALLEGIEL